MTDFTFNIQNLVPLFAYLDSDAVERKFLDPRVSYMERMSTSWSLLGRLGLIRAFAKIGFGLSNAERAGAQLHSGGAYTAKKTKHALASCSTSASMETEHWWQDDHHQLLGCIDLQNTPWKRPHAIVFGYTQCPRVGTRVILEHAWNIGWAIASFLLTLSGLWVLYPEQEHACMSFWFAAVILSGIIAIITDNMHHSNTSHSSGAQAIFSGKLFSSNKEQQGCNFTRDPFMIMSSAKKSSSIGVRYSSTHHPWYRAADGLLTRLASSFAAFGILVVCCCTYVLLERVTQRQATIWMAVEVMIFASRYILWSDEMCRSPWRGRSLIYITSGSLYTPLSTLPSTDQSGLNQSALLTADLIQYAVTSARSKLLNAEFKANHLCLGPLTRLALCAPSDILRASYCNVLQLSQENHGLPVWVIRLPWSFLEELYAVQGLILGKNPWVVDGIYLAAIVHDGCFIGLTTVHSIERTARLPRDTACEKSVEYPPQAVGITADGLVIDSLVEGKVLVPYSYGVSKELAESHARFCVNVTTCRDSALANGPSYSEVHLHHADGGPEGKVHVRRTEPSFEAALQVIDNLLQAMNGRDHLTCDQYCSLSF